MNPHTFISHPTARYETPDEPGEAMSETPRLDIYRVHTNYGETRYLPAWDEDDAARRFWDAWNAEPHAETVDLRPLTFTVNSTG